jgi:hypothetical protein
MKRRVSRTVTPARAVAYGAVAGLASTVLLTILMRVAPGMQDKDEKQKVSPDVPANPFDPHAVQQWQDCSRSPAAYSPALVAEKATTVAEAKIHPSVVTPAGALAEAQGPGPEGAAERFALKLSAGLFDSDISPRVKLAGQLVHYTYGTFWGIVYGLSHFSLRRPPSVLGPAFGFGLWAFGPGFLVPRMRVMRPPSLEPPFRTAVMIGGHIMFGMSLAALCERLRKRR